MSGSNKRHLHHDRVQLIRDFAHDARQTENYFRHVDNDETMSLQIKTTSKVLRQFGSEIASPPLYNFGIILFSEFDSQQIATPFILRQSSEQRLRGGVGWHEQIAQTIIDTVNGDDLREARAITTELFPMVCGKVACRLIFFDNFDGMSSAYNWSDQDVDDKAVDSLRQLSESTRQVVYFTRNKNTEGLHHARIESGNTTKA